MLSSGGGDKVVGAGQGMAQGGKESQGQLGGVIGGVQGKVISTSLSLGPCSHCSAQGELWAVCLQIMGMRLCALCMAYQTGNGISNRQWHIKQAMTYQKGNGISNSRLAAAQAYCT